MSRKKQLIYLFAAILILLVSTNEIVNYIIISKSKEIIELLGGVTPTVKETVKIDNDPKNSELIEIGTYKFLIPAACPDITHGKDFTFYGYHHFSINIYYGHYAKNFDNAKNYKIDKLTNPDALFRDAGELTFHKLFWDNLVIYERYKIISKYINDSYINKYYNNKYDIIDVVHDRNDGLYHYIYISKKNDSVIVGIIISASKNNGHVIDNKLHEIVQLVINSYCKYNSDMEIGDV